MSLVQITHPRVPSLEHVLLKERLFSTVNLNIWSFMFYFFGFRCWNKELLQKNGLWTGGAVYGEKPLLKQRGIPGEYRLTCRTLTLRGSLHPTYYWTGHEDYRVCVCVCVCVVRTKQTALFCYMPAKEYSVVLLWRPWCKYQCLLERYTILHWP